MERYCLLFYEGDRQDTQNLCWESFFCKTSIKNILITMFSSLNCSLLYFLKHFPIADCLSFSLFARHRVFFFSHCFVHVLNFEQNPLLVIICSSVVLKMICFVFFLLSLCHSVLCVFVGRIIGLKRERERECVRGSEREGYCFLSTMKPPQRLGTCLQFLFCFFCTSSS